MGAFEGKILIAFTTAGAFILFVSAYFFYHIFRQHRKYRELEKAKLDAEIYSSELERNNIATELHNDIAPQLASIKMRLHLIESNNPNQIEECSEAISNCIQQIRMISRDLAPISLYELDYQIAIKQYLHDFRVEEHLSVEFIELDDINLTHVQNNYVYRILQEIIHNAVKHSKGKHLKIEISKENDFLVIRTADDGIGFSMNKIKSTNKLGYGLLGIQSKVDYLNGTLVLDEKNKTGTVYNIHVPLKTKF
ncbi:MAG: hypothetical protein FGM46_10165 [Ferruginibacter sp.]|nr:hypothetical protein [Ferruginibacter sp.]